MAVVCVDSLAGVKFPDVIAQLDKKYGTGYFYEEFGPAKNQITVDAGSGRVLVRIQGLWAGKSHNYTDAHRKRSLEIAAELNRIGIPIYYSPFCEHRKKSAYMRSLLTEIRTRFPNVIPVNSPISGGEWVDGFINEIHNYDKPAGMPRGQFIFSMDGLHQPDCDITEFYKYLDNPSCIAFFVWALQDNAKRNAKDETPAKQRKCKPTHDLHLSMIFQLENRKKSVKLNDGHILKTHSEQHNDVDPRANKLTYVGPKGSSPQKVKVGTLDLVKSGFTDDKRPVFRSMKWAYKQGRIVALLVDGKNVGTVDQPYRQNEWKRKT